jgi:hypothetical protein
MRTRSLTTRIRFALLASPLLLGSCGGDTGPTIGAKSGETGTLTLRPLVCWLAKGKDSATQFGVPMREGLPPDRMLKALAWGHSGDLWLGFDKGFGRIADPTSLAEIELFPMPSTPEGDTLAPQVLAPRGPGGRIAVGTYSGYVAVSVPGRPETVRTLPIRSLPGAAGIMPWVGWTSAGTLTASVHITCDLVGLNADTGTDVWRRTEQVARYPSGSPNGKFLLLPWAEGDAAAEVLDAATGTTISSLPNSDASRVYGAVDDTGRWVVQGRYDADLVVWETTSNSVERVRIAGEGALPIALAFLPGTTRCVVATSNALWVLEATTRQWHAHWTTPAGATLNTFVPQSDLAVSHDGSRVAVRVQDVLLVLEVSTQR